MEDYRLNKVFLILSLLIDGENEKDFPFKSS